MSIQITDISELKDVFIIQGRDINITFSKERKVERAATI